MVKNLSGLERSHTNQQKNSKMFQLRNKKRQVVYQADFTPVKAISQTRGKKMLKEFSIIPTFNLDKKFYSEAFYNPFEGPEIDQNSKVKHFEMVKEISTQIPPDNILLPKPRRKNHCWVCSCDFNDYLEHIESDDHRRCINKSAFNRDIMSLVRKYQERQQIKNIISGRHMLRNKGKNKGIAL